MAIQTIKKNGVPVAFQAQIRVRGETGATKTFDNYEECEEYEQNTIKMIRASRSIPETDRVYRRGMKPKGVAALAAMKVSQVADDFVEVNRDHCYAPYASRIKAFVGDARVCELDKTWTKNFCEKLRKTKAWRRDHCLADSTINCYMSVIRRICNWKAESLGIEKPSLGLTTEFLDPGWDDGRERRLEGDEEERIRAGLGLVGSKLNKKTGKRSAPMEAARHYQLLFDFAIETCARQDEMAQLPWKEINVERRVWTLPARRSKTKSTRKIYLTPRALEVLEELQQDNGLRNGRVFFRLPSSRGVSNTFRSMINRLGIEDYVFHDLRHEGITRHRLAKNFEPEVLMKMAGHKSAKMTMRYFNPQDDEILARMEQNMLNRHIGMPAAPLGGSPEHAALAQEFLAFLAARKEPLRL